METCAKILRSVKYLLYFLLDKDWAQQCYSGCERSDLIVRVCFHYSDAQNGCEFDAALFIGEETLDCRF
jgi:hypothetical protein